jgi:hypothetical protein
MKIAEPLRPKVSHAVRTDASMKKTIAAMFSPVPEGVPDLLPEEKAEAVIQLVTEKVSDALADETLPGRRKYIGGLMRELLDDAALKKLLS